MPVQAMKVTVHGRVQAVGFRFTTRRVANDLGLEGWVRNRTDGAVEVWVQGPEDAVSRLLSFLRTGPPGAVVESVSAERVEPDPDLEGFQITF